MQVLHSELVVLVVSLLVLDFTKHSDALPSPDFGVQATINPVRNDVLSGSNRLRSALNAVTDTTIQLVSGTPMLQQLEVAIVSIGNKFKASGLNLTQQLQNLANSNGPTISGVFVPVYETIQTLHDLTIDGLTGEMMSIAQVVTSSITQKFNQVFGELRKALNYLNSKLQMLEADVRQARSMAGSASSISATIVRNNVPAQTQSDVAKALLELRLQIDVVRYMVRSTLLYLQEADDLLYDIVLEVNGFGQALNSSLANFALDMDGLKQSTMQYASRSFGCSLAEQNATLVPYLPVLSQIANFSTTIQPPLEAMLALLTPGHLSSLLNDFANQYTTYISAAVAIEGAQGVFVRSVTCELLKKLVLTLISLGPQNEYCFNRYASRVFGMYELHHNVVTECFEAETQRLTTLSGFLRNAVDVLLYEVEDLADNLVVCATLVNGRTDCITQFGLKYTTVAQLFVSMFQSARKFYVEEFVASGERLGACVVSSQHRTLNSVARLEQRVDMCQQMH